VTLEIFTQDIKDMALEYLLRNHHIDCYPSDLLIRILPQAPEYQFRALIDVKKRNLIKLDVTYTEKRGYVLNVLETLTCFSVEKGYSFNVQEGCNK